jgi:hypothetical protein
VLEIQEAAGRRIRRVALEEPYIRSHEVYLLIQFDDETEIQIEIECRPWFAIRHLGHDAGGDIQPLTKAVRGSLQSLTKTLS